MKVLQVVQSGKPTGCTDDFLAQILVSSGKMELLRMANVTDLKISSIGWKSSSLSPYQ